MKIIYKCIFLTIFFHHICFSSENFGDAMKWYDVNNGSANQNYIFGIIEENKGNLILAKKYLKVSASQGYQAAMLRLGFILSNSKNPKEIEEAFFWLNKSMNNGYSEAAILLGSIFEKGERVKKDIYKASKFYKRAIKLGNNVPYLYLANLALNGQENEPNIFLSLAYTILATRKKVEGSEDFFNNIIPYVNEKNWTEVEILINAIESEINKM